MPAPDTAHTAQYAKMTGTPIPKLVVTLAIPTIISMMTTAIYNMADTFFVSQLGTSAAGAVGIVFSLMAVIQAIGFMLGMGAGSLNSRLLGAQKNREADEVGSTAFFCALGFGLLLTVGGLIFLDPLMRILGATETILPYARSYAQYILYGAPIMCSSFVLNNLARLLQIDVKCVAKFAFVRGNLSKRVFVSKHTDFCPCTFSETGQRPLLPIICKSTDFPTASRLRSEGTSLKSHRLNSDTCLCYSSFTPFIASSAFRIISNCSLLQKGFSLSIS